MKRSLFIVITILAVASLVAVMSYTSATVTNAAELRVHNSNSSLLALRPENGIGTRDDTAYFSMDGKLMFEFGRGVALDNHGVQHNSVYTWGDCTDSDKASGLFQIDNDSKEKLESAWRPPAYLRESRLKLALLTNRVLA
jgi:hypothetical protein